MPFAANPRHPLLLGHRGARGQKSIPENSFAAFDFALAHGCDGFEFDVRLSADGHAVICHDPKTRGLEIAKTRAHDLALPLLIAVLRRYQLCAFLNIELKVEGLEKIVLDLVASRPPQLGCLISSFIPEVLTQIHALDPAIPLGLICETAAQLQRWSGLPIQYVIPQYKLVRKKEIVEIKERKKRVVLWTVNSPRQLRQFTEWGVDGLISDYPRRLSLVRDAGVETDQAELDQAETDQAETDQPKIKTK